MSLTALTPDFTPSLPFELEVAFVGVDGTEVLPGPLEILDRAERASERMELLSESRWGVGFVVMLDELEVDDTEVGR